MKLAPDGTILWKRPEAARLLEDDDDFTVRGGRLRLRNAKLDERLRTHLYWAEKMGEGIMPTRAAVPPVHFGRGGRPPHRLVAAEGGRIIMILEDRRSAAEKVRQGIRVFDLSPAQAQLAEAIVAGQTSADWARSRNLSHNTARTHLRRLFEKVGVNNQASLAEVLVSVTPPR